jgi:hypothetical protein
LRRIATCAEQSLDQIREPINTVKTDNISTAIVLGGTPVDAARLIMMRSFRG